MAERRLVLPPGVNPPGVVMSASIIPFVREAVFDPEATRIMSEAYDKACKMLHDKGQPAVVQEIMARRIIEIAKSGERDPDRICARVLAAFGLSKIE